MKIERCCLIASLAKTKEKWEDAHAKQLAHYEACEFAKDNYAE